MDPQTVSNGIAVGRRPIWWLFLLGQVILLVIEVATNYDTAVRQYALAFTNLASTIGLFWFDRWLGRRGGRLSMATWLIVAGAVWLDALGNFQHLYAGYWWYDRLSHTIGGMAVSALFIDFFLTQAKRGRWLIGAWPAIWFGFLLGQMMAAFYEITEWLGDMWFDTHRVVYTYDTPHDLFFNLLGGLVMVALIQFSQRKKPQ